LIGPSHFKKPFLERTIFPERRRYARTSRYCGFRHLFGVELKLTSFVTLTAEAAARSKTTASVDVSQMHQNTNPSGEQP
jgi:hypothetical protein